jgi:DNA adenine methylase
MGSRRRRAVKKRRIETPRPIVKWAGGKELSAQQIMAVMPKKFNCYIEPFFGGGALFFALKRAGRIDKAVLSDCNRELINMHLCVANDLVGVLKEIALLNPHYVTEESYYRVRDSIPDSVNGKAARTLFLNKTCYNGLYRVNKSNGFNSPWGQRVKWDVDVENLAAASKALQGAVLKTNRFTIVVDDAEKGDVVYLDPPYFPVSKSANFVNYSRDGFTYSDQLQVASKFSELAARGVCVIASNADLSIVREIYGGIKRVNMATIMVPRRVNSKGEGRGLVPELLIWANGRKPEEVELSTEAAE